MDENYSISISGLENDEFYYLSKTDKAFGYWLASPSSSSGCVMNVNYNGEARGDGYTHQSIGIRPVVCLKSDIQVSSTIEEDGMMTWNIIQN